MQKLAAQLEATLYVFGQRLAHRDERGQTTAEYVGIVAFVAALVVLVIALAPNFTSTVQSIIDTAFQNISDAMG